MKSNQNANSEESAQLVEDNTADPKISHETLGKRVWLCVVIVSAISGLIAGMLVYVLSKFNFSTKMSVWMPTVVVGIITVAGTLYQGKIRIRADIMSQSRIAWINEVRKQTVELLKLYSELQHEGSLYKYKAHREADYSDQRPYLIIEDKIRATTASLKLYFSPTLNEKSELHISFEKQSSVKIFVDSQDPTNKEDAKESLDAAKTEKSKNQKAFRFLMNEATNSGKNDLINELLSGTEGLILVSSRPEDKSPEYKRQMTNAEVAGIWNLIHENLQHLSDIVSLYLKVEWDRAKNGK